jgi:hypothetical protein
MVVSMQKRPGLMSNFVIELVRECIAWINDAVEDKPWICRPLRSRRKKHKKAAAEIYQSQSWFFPSRLRVFA